MWQRKPPERVWKGNRAWVVNLREQVKENQLHLVGERWQVEGLTKGRACQCVGISRWVPPTSLPLGVCACVSGGRQAQ